MILKNGLFQFLLQSYSAGFNYTNRNSSSEQVIYKYINIQYELFIFSQSSLFLLDVICVYLSPPE